VVLIERDLYIVPIFQLSLYIFAEDAISKRRKLLNSSSLYHERFRPSNKRPNPLTYGHDVLQITCIR
jgi:hypothetical protein